MSTILDTVTLVALFTGRDMNRGTRHTALIIYCKLIMYWKSLFTGKKEVEPDTYGLMGSQPVVTKTAKILQGFSSLLLGPRLFVSMIY